MLIAFEDNIPLTLFRRLKCRFGYHSTIKKFGKAKVNKYYCSICKKPRKHPGLKMIEGGNKLGSNRFDF